MKDAFSVHEISATTAWGIFLNNAGMQMVLEVYLPKGSQEIIAVELIYNFSNGATSYNDCRTLWNTWGKPVVPKLAQSVNIETYIDQRTKGQKIIQSPYVS